MVTYVTQMGVKIKVTKPVIARMVLPEGVELVTRRWTWDTWMDDLRSS